MTNEERMRIAELQRQGYGYKKIATITGLPQNTVKSYCSRHPLQKNDFAESEGLRRNCKKPLEQTPHKRQKKFCSDFCRMAWWNAHPERVQRKAYYTLTCRHCGKQFESYGNSHRVFCSRDCYLKFRRKEADHE
ncbi:RNA polymerase subunit sigma-70 [Ruminococcus sp.]|uniref:RNA polymerase subunit sigma-70 n=1 Tax=Ruminococcus sp. TaxID=41978 RepID=UPI00352261EB